MGFTTFEASTSFRGFFVPLSFVTCAFLFTILVFGDAIRFSDPQHLYLKTAMEANRTAGLISPSAISIPDVIGRTRLNFLGSNFTLNSGNSPNSKAPTQTRHLGSTHHGANPFLPSPTLFSTISQPFPPIDALPTEAPDRE
jgi:hypothetical protein